MRRLRVVVILAMLVALLSTSAASADKPLRYEFTLSGTGVMTDVCPFPITIEATSTGTETVFFDKTGAVVRVHDQVVENDTFSANGKSLESESYSYSAEWIIDSSGNLEHVYVSGVAVKVRLPDGGLFIAAGRSDFMAHPGTQFIIVPDHGTATNLDGFCAALAP